MVYDDLPKHITFFLSPEVVAMGNVQCIQGATMPLVHSSCPWECVPDQGILQNVLRQGVDLESSRLYLSLS